VSDPKEIGHSETLSPAAERADLIHNLKATVLRAKHRDGEELVTVSVEQVLALFDDRERMRRARKKFRWLWHRQKAHIERQGQEIARLKRPDLYADPHIKRSTLGHILGSD